MSKSDPSGDGKRRPSPSGSGQKATAAPMSATGRMAWVELRALGGSGPGLGQRERAGAGPHGSVGGIQRSAGRWEAPSAASGWG